MGIKLNPEEQPLVHMERMDTNVASDNNLTPEQALENLYEKESADIDAAYDTKISNSDTLYQDQIDAAETWKKEQTKLQQEQTEFAIDHIEQQKAQAEKNYQQEQSAAYVDYKKQADPYGVNAEQMASMGMAGTGYSETSKVSMYNQYQYRVAVAKRNLGEATVAYDNMIKEAKLQNNSALAQLALETYKQTSALALEKLQTRDELLEEKASEKAKLNKKYAEILDAILAEQEEEETLEIDPTTNETGILPGLLEGAITGVSVFEGGNAPSSQEASTPHISPVAAILDPVGSGFLITPEEAAQMRETELRPQASPIMAKPKAFGHRFTRLGVSDSEVEQVQQIEQNRQAKEEEKIANGEFPIDWESVSDLGFGVIGAKELDKLVREGKIEEYVADGKLKFRKSMKFLLPQFNSNT